MSAVVVASPAPADELSASIGRHVRLGMILSGMLCLGIFGWGGFAQLAGAVVAHGQVVVESSAKKVQHPTGGVVSAIKVQEGTSVRAGDVLVTLDDTQPRANLAVVSQSLDELLGRRSRLEAERDGAASVTFPSDLVRRAEEDADVAKILNGERRLFEARMTARNGQKDQLGQRVEQLRQDIEGRTAQQLSKREEMQLIETELSGLSGLYAKKLVPLARLTALQREVARLDGERGQLVSSIAEAKGRIAETELQIIQVDQDLRTEVLRDLRETDGKIEEMRQRQVSAADQLARVEIRSPQDGVVNQLAIHTVGGVVGPGETLMQVVPGHDRLVIDAKVLPQDVDQVAIGQQAIVRLSAFSQQTTPEVTGVVETVSADLVRDPSAVMAEPPYYAVRVRLSDADIAALRGVKLLPGMPAEIHLQTGTRSALSFFMKPLTDQFSRAFREQ